MDIAIIENGQVTQIGDYRTLFPNTSFPNNGPDAEFLSANNAKKVNLFKDHDRLTEKLVSCEPYDDGDFVSRVKVESLTDEEIQAAKDSAMAALRAHRNLLLSQSDWTQIPDCTLTNKADWAAYRQALRDLPEIVSDARTFSDWPHDPNWKPMIEE